MVSAAASQKRPVFWRRVISAIVIVLIIFGLRHCYAPITWGLSGGIRSTDESWSSRIHEVYPDGTTENWLVWSLRAQGFRVNRKDGSAVLETGIFPVCDFYYDVAWSATDGGRVRNVHGRVEDVCV